MSVSRCTHRTRQNLGQQPDISPALPFTDPYGHQQDPFEMQSVKTFMVPKTGKHFELDDFVREQKSERENVKQHYNDKVDEIIKKLRYWSRLSVRAGL